MKLSPLLLFLTLFILKANFICAEDNKIQIKFHFFFENEKLILYDKYYTLNENDSMNVESFKFYISGIEFYDQGKKVYEEDSSYHLIDASDLNSISFEIKTSSKIKFNSIRLHLGIDSITSVSGAMGGALDPMHGMYWTWQSGYINFKLEGKSNLCDTRNNEFQFHLGGYQSPFIAFKTINLNVKNTQEINISFDVQKLLRQINLKDINHVMSPCIEAVLLSQSAAEIFKVIPKRK